MSEEGLGSVMGELMANERMRKGLGRAGERLMANKHVFDRNVETVLDFVNIPSKRDIRELKSRLDTLSSQLVNLSMKIDRMLAADDTPAPRHVRAGVGRSHSGSASPAGARRTASGAAPAQGPRRRQAIPTDQTKASIRRGTEPRRLRHAFTELRDSAPAGRGRQVQPARRPRSGAASSC